MEHKFKVGELIRARRDVENSYVITNPENNYVGVVTRLFDPDIDYSEPTIRAGTIACMSGNEDGNYRLVEDLFEPYPLNFSFDSTLKNILEIAKRRLEECGVLMTAETNFPELYEEEYIDKSKLDAFNKSFEELF